MAGDAVAVMASVLISLYIWSRVADEPFTSDFVTPQLWWFFALTIIWLVLASANDFYQLSAVARRADAIQRLSVISAQMVVVYLVVFFVSPREELPRLFIIYYGFSSFILIGLWRIANPALLGWASSRRRILIVGADESTATLIDAINRYGENAFEVCGIISREEDVGKEIAGVPVIGAGQDLPNFVARDRIRELVITSIPDMNDDIFRGVMQAYEYGRTLTPMPIFYERMTARVPIQYVNNDWAIVLPIEGQSILNPYPTIQRLTDILLSLIGGAILLVALVPLGLAIKLDSPGSIFYWQTRVGVNGRLFRIVKFRTMRQDAEADTGAVFSQRGDPRVTRVGKFLRRSRLDELPQVYNTLRGQMSIVGPRPERPEHVARLTEKIPFYRTRLIVRPGLTGWAQVRYNYGSDDEDARVKLEYDLYYIRNQSLLLDVNIIIRTIGKVIRLGGV